jgi:hypothetical protein
MREYAIAVLILLNLPLAAQVAPSGWQIVKDSKNACQLAVPPDWSLYGESHSAAVLHDASTALVVVTSQPGQAFAPLSERLKSILNISKEKLFENTANRIFYEDKSSAHPADPKWYTFSVYVQRPREERHLQRQTDLSAELTGRFSSPDCVQSRTGPGNT